MDVTDDLYKRIWGCARDFLGAGRQAKGGHVFISIARNQWIYNGPTIRDKLVYGDLILVDSC